MLATVATGAKQLELLPLCCHVFCTSSHSKKPKQLSTFPSNGQRWVEKSSYWAQWSWTALRRQCGSLILTSTSELCGLNEKSPQQGALESSNLSMGHTYFLNKRIQGEHTICHLPGSTVVKVNKLLNPSLHYLKQRLKMSCCIFSLEIN